MELKATTLGKRLAQHPYDRAVILNAGIKVSGDRHEYLIPFNQLLAIHCKRGLVWGELEFVLPDEKVVRLHGTEWGETQRFYHHLDAHWQRWSGEMSEIASGVLRQQLDLIATRTGENKWLTREQTSGVQQQIRQAMSALPLPVNRLEEFDNCREAWRKCQAWLKDIESARLQHNQAYTEDITARTFHALALHIIQQGSKKVPIVSKLENDTAARHELFIAEWRKQCSEKKAQAKGWRQWLTEEMQWSVPEGNFWDDEKLQRRLASRLDRWVSLMRMHGGAQAEMIASAPEEIRDLFSKRIKLMAPLLKAWKGALKAENAVDFSGLIHQAIVILEKGRFISPWKHILVDEFQDISPQRAALLAALRKQNSQTTLFAVGDDWQAIYRFSGAQMSLTTAFHENFGEGDRCDLDTTYRFNSRIGEVANRFIQQNPGQLKKPLNSLTNGDEKAVTLLDESQLDALLDKLSGYAKPEERILILARYHHMRPASLEKAATRWPKLQIDFMTIHASKGQQADYVIIVGLQEGSDGFPAAARESIMEEALLPPVEDFPDAEERRLMYVALTRARHRVWALFNKENPSPFVEILKNLDVPVARKP
ncbi:DNA helicase IV [Escherichia coli]|uniref:DNA helicase IV n=1 Tax=Escherichia coli TaxID=562 RepID=UPI0013D057DB|nr:DNA helicase IV [Escherichia coli]NGK75870.1 DNA helicase IV [Escherichia coli]